MVQFYLSKTDPSADVDRCKESVRSRQPITITGSTLDGQIRAFTGVVQSIEDDSARADATLARDYERLSDFKLTHYPLIRGLYL